MEHIIRAAGDVLREDTIYVIGSQALLACFAEDSLPEARVCRLRFSVRSVPDRGSGGTENGERAGAERRAGRGSPSGTRGA